MSFPSEKNDWERFEKSNAKIAINVLYAKKEKIHPAYISKCEKYVNLLMISNGEKWHYLAVKKAIGIVKRNYIKKYLQFLLFELFSFL